MKSDCLTSAHEELKHLSVVEPLHRLAVDVGDQVSWPEACVEGWTSLVHLHHQVVHGEEISVTKVHPYGPHGEPKAPWTSPDDDRRLKGVYKWRDISARGGVSTAGSATSSRALDDSTSATNNRTNASSTACTCCSWLGAFGQRND